ncbi:X-Pro dipeptidyl-peptidase-domain-containing protein, partial [Haematococcus lacustris]
MLLARRAASARCVVAPFASGLARNWFHRPVGRGRRSQRNCSNWSQGLDPWDLPEDMPPYFQFDDADTHSHVVVSTFMVPMRDSVRLASTVYRPSFGGDVPVQEPLPVVLHRTPYNKTADRFARRGYVVMIQDCRGRYQSEGRFTKYVNEGHDGVDTLAWIRAQPWCNGKIGCF